MEEKIKAIAEYCGWRKIRDSGFWADGDFGMYDPNTGLTDHGLKSLLNTLHADRRIHEVEIRLVNDGSGVYIYSAIHAGRQHFEVTVPDLETALINATFTMLESLSQNPSG